MEETEIIPVGWYSQREASDTQQNPCLVKDIFWEKKLVEWISKREANNTTCDCGHLNGAIKETEIITGG